MEVDWDRINLCRADTTNLLDWEHRWRVPDVVPLGADYNDTDIVDDFDDIDGEDSIGSDHEDSGDEDAEVQEFGLDDLELIDSDGDDTYVYSDQDEDG